MISKFFDQSKDRNRRVIFNFQQKGDKVFLLGTEEKQWSIRRTKPRFLTEQKFRIEREWCSFVKRNAKMLNQQVYKSGIVINRLTGARFQRWDAIN